MNSPNIGSILISLLGGLAIFILGMSLMTQALNNLAGARMKALLGAFTKNRFTATLSGIAITATVQSSSVTTVLLVGFSSVGLITAAQSVGVIFGANVGSTVTAQIIAFKIAEAGAPLLALGLVLSFIKKYERLSQVGMLILGLGAIFFGMQEMGDATRPLRTYQPFLDAMQTIDSPLWGILIGLAFTAIVQSSAATIGLAMVFANQGLLPLEGAISIAFGANIGTCITAALAALGRPPAAWRIVFIHVVFNTVGVALWVAFIPQLSEASQYLADSLLGDHSLGRKIAIAHTVFNVINLLIFIGFAGPLARLAYRVVPDKIHRPQNASKPIYLDPLFLDTPSLAIDRARLETGRLAAIALKMSEEIPIAAISSDASRLNELAKCDDEVDDLQTEILNYLAKIDATKLEKRDQAAIHEVITLVNTWENIGDTLDNHILPLGHDRLRTGLVISDATKKALLSLHQELLKNMRLAMLVTTNRDPDDIKKLLAAKEAYNKLAETAERDLQTRLVGRELTRMELFRLESDLIGNLKRVHYYVRRVAKISLHEA
ncbi:Na/Pi-cotransporter II-related protein, putative [Verrucomicrobiia bacterium DG1235]|nr:Na/Pi-cotransporter II-related protein, putative [Verrucomicrobiae bacterium DG1235]